MSRNVLKIELYGDTRIEFGGKELTNILSKKSVGLIAYLMCTPSHQASKNTLKDLLWIDAGEKAAYNLRFNLWSIKKNIPEIDGENFIITTGGICRINPAYPIVRTGLEKLEDRGTAKAEELADIVEAGGSMTFMEHFYLKNCDDFNDWLILERNNRERKVITALTKASDYFEERGEYERALNVLNKMIFLSPFEDDIHIRVMRIQEKLGNFGEVVREYRNYCDWLDKELSVAPSKSFREIYMSIAEKEQMDDRRVIRIKDKVYNSDFAAAADMLRRIIPRLNEGINVEIDNWNSLDQKSKELIEVLAKERIIIIGR